MLGRIRQRRYLGETIPDTFIIAAQKSVSSNFYFGTLRVSTKGASERMKRSKRVKQNYRDPNCSVAERACYLVEAIS